MKFSKVELRDLWGLINGHSKFPNYSSGLIEVPFTIPIWDFEEMYRHAVNESRPGTSAGVSLKLTDVIQALRNGRIINHKRSCSTLPYLSGTENTALSVYYTDLTDGKRKAIGIPGLDYLYQ